MAEIDRKRIASLTEAQQEQFRNRTGRSAQTFERAVRSMPGGVPSSFQENDPWPVYIDRGEGSRVWDVDGNEYADFHNGFGVMCIGHANPTVGAAVKAQTAPYKYPRIVEFAEELPKTNSGKIRRAALRAPSD